MCEFGRNCEKICLNKCKNNHYSSDFPCPKGIKCNNTYCRCNHTLTNIPCPGNDKCVFITNGWCHHLHENTYVQKTNIISCRNGIRCKKLYLGICKNHYNGDIPCKDGVKCKNKQNCDYNHKITNIKCPANNNCIYKDYWCCNFHKNIKKNDDEYKEDDIDTYYDDILYCIYCDKYLNSDQQLFNHKKGKKHIENYNIYYSLQNTENQHNKKIFKIVNKNDNNKNNNNDKNDNDDDDDDNNKNNNDKNNNDKNNIFKCFSFLSYILEYLKNK